MTKIQQIKQFAKEHLDDVRWVHTQQVVKTALEIAKHEGADLEVVEVSAWMHDTGSSQKGANVYNHQFPSVKLSQKIMKKLGYDKNIIDRVTQCILEHSGPIHKDTEKNLKKYGLSLKDIPRPSTIESKCLYDADMINLSGPMGLVKGLRFMPDKDIKFIFDFQQNLADLAYRDLKTNSGKLIGRKYHQTSSEMFKLLNL